MEDVGAAADQSHWEGGPVPAWVLQRSACCEVLTGEFSPKFPGSGNHRPWAHLRADKKLKQSCHNTQKVTKRKHTVPG